MRYFVLVLVLCVMAFSATFNGPAYSQRRAGTCDQTLSTADTLDCINQDNQNIQSKMSATFKLLMEGQEDQNRPLLSEAQKDWILYRDAQCAWEAGLTDTPALKRVYELSCLTEMTERRISLLETVKGREEQQAPREFGTQPRWMNALATDYPDIFWRYGHYKNADMDCDGVDEQIMTGISVNLSTAKPAASDSDTSAPAGHEVEVVISISENPQTGRPKAVLLRLPVSPQQEGPHLCRPAAKMEIKDRPAPAMAETSEEGQVPEAVADPTVSTPSCKVLQISDDSCAPVTIIWNGKNYAFQPPAGEGDAL